LAPFWTTFDYGRKKSLELIEISKIGKRHYQVINYDPSASDKKFDLWFTNNDDWHVDVDPRNINTARSAYANALEFGPRRFATRGISNP